MQNNRRRRPVMKVLLAEDEEDLNDIIVKKLRAEGYEVDSSFDGEDALEHLLYADYDVAIMDIMMPVMDGIEALKAIRRNKKQTPVIFLTAKDTLQDKITGLDEGASDYIVKPFSFDELMARLRSVVRTAQGNVSDIYELDNLVVDVQSHVVKRNNQKISLTGKEYNLLEYLIMNKNKILSREKILNHVWGYDYEGGNNIVDVYINYLRNKIENGSEKKLLHTVRGIGYVMKDEEY